MTVFPQYSWFLSPQIVKTMNTKPVNSEGRLYIKMAFMNLHLNKATLTLSTNRLFSSLKLNLQIEQKV